MLKALKAILNNHRVQLRLFWTLWILVVLALSLWFLWDAGYRFNVTESLPRGIYKLSPGAPARGEQVMFCPEGELAAFAQERGYLGAGSCPSGVRPLLKIAAAVPGDALTQNEYGISINGALWPDSTPRTEDSQGRSLSPAPLPGVVPPGLILLLSDKHPGGFDSRYFGPVPAADLLRVEPVFTF